MQLDREFIRLPFSFDAARLAEEVAQFAEEDWRPHPQGYPGNTALTLIATEGDPRSDAVNGAMRPTPHLDRCPYLRQTLAAFHAVWGRTRLMRLDGNAEATLHSDSNYYWAHHTRVHVPILTDPAVKFFCGTASLHMAAGESWIFDTWRPHNVVNPNETRRIHLVADTVGSAAFWKSVDQGRRGATPVDVPYDPVKMARLATESVNQPIVMSPSEQRELWRLIQSSLANGAPADAREELDARLDGFLHDWTAAWARFGESRDGWPLYRQLIDAVKASIEPIRGRLRLRNTVDAVDAVTDLLIRPAMEESPADGRMQPRRGGQVRRSSGRFDRPIFIVCSPRSGSSLFFEALSQSPTLWTIGGESHGVIEGIPMLHPAQRRFHSNRLTAADATPVIVADLEKRFARQLRNRDGVVAPPGAMGLRMLEKTPKNSLRVPFLAETFPDALFIYLYRDMRDTISSMLDAWRSGKFVTYPDLPGWEGLPWSLLLTPGWRDLSGKPLAEIVAAQWSTATRYLLDDLEQLDPARWCVAGYDALVNDPQKEIQRLSRFLGIEWDRQLTAPLPQSKTTLTPPDREKWKRNAADLEVALPLVEDVAERARSLFAHPPERETKAAAAVAAGGAANAEATADPAAPPAEERPPFRSVFTPSFTEILERTGGSLLVSTYQTGRLVILRMFEKTLNTHFRAFASPMGIAMAADTISLGTRTGILHFRNHPQLTLARKDEKLDAVYVPIASHTTGDIRVHELGWAQGSLIVVNTRFSCLCTVDGLHSFVPIWKPKFISQLTAEDRCHLNGLCVIDDRVRFVTALGTTDEAAGWRANKSSGGVIIDVASDDIVVSGLSMPHSPRWYDGRLWVLESGHGRLSVVDLRSGKAETVAEVPGFSRGLAFWGPYAFIGLSQVREHVFQGIPIAEKAERQCGVWVVDIRTGEIAGFVRFEGAVQEIFDVQLLANVAHPDVLEPFDNAVGASFLLPPVQEPVAAG